MECNISGFFVRVMKGTPLLMIPVLLAGAPVAKAVDNVYLYGALVAEPCLIPAGEETIALDFGTVIDKSLYQNTRTAGQAFSLHLTECDVSLGKTLKVTFQGTESQALPGLLALDAGSQAKGIAIGLETTGAKALPINRASESYRLQNGDNRIALRAYVRGEPEAIRQQRIGRGGFSATATFSLEYE